MSLNSFKELLLRKNNHEELNKYIDVLGDTEFMSYVFGSLEKMATIKQNDSANHTVNWTAKNMLPTHADMYRDALSHHVSHYKAALNNNNENLADQHMAQVMKLLNFGTRLGNHSYKGHDDSHREGREKLNVEAVPDQPWQKQALQMPPGNFGRHIKNPQEGNNYAALRGSPHGHKKYAIEINNHLKEGNDYTGAWPVEKIKVNDKYINVNDIESPGKYTPHEFDSHPAIEYVSKPQHKMTDEDHHDFIKRAMEWHSPDNPEVHKWFDKQEENPTAHGRDEPSDPVHKELDHYHPVKTDEKGNVQVDSQGHPIYQVDENGKPIIPKDESGEPIEHDPQKHKLRLRHALENPELYHAPTLNKQKKRSTAEKKVKELMQEPTQESSKSNAPTTEEKKISAKDKKVIDNLKNIKTTGLPDKIIKDTLNRYSDHIVEAAGLKELKEKLNAKS